MKRNIQFVEGEYYHIYNRGVEKRKIFMNQTDHNRFMHDINEFNDKNYSPLSFSYRVGLPKPNRISNDKKKEEQRIKLVEIYCFCLMPNHFHFILKQLREGGIPLFMKKMGMGYANYFNFKYERTGALFQGSYKAAHIKTDDQMVHLSRYIHLNPIDIFQPNWKETGIKDLKGAKEFLRNYKWSSFLDYIGIKNYPLLIDKEFILKNYFKNDGKKYEKVVMSVLAGDNLSKIESFF